MVLAKRAGVDRQPRREAVVQSVDLAHHLRSVCLVMEVHAFERIDLA
jgi:hypothetical protein